MLKICLVGAAGKMGSAIINKVKSADDFVIVAAVDVKKNENEYGVSFYERLEDVQENYDIIIDFSAPDNVPSSLIVSQKLQVPLVCGVTGLDMPMLNYMKKISVTTKIFYSPNMSIGIAVMSEAVKLASRTLAEDFEIEISEIHHNEKLDAPSGTSLFLGEIAATSRGWETDQAFCFQRFGRSKREKKQIGFAVMRGGDVAGTHTVNFLGQQESLEITHRVFSRSVFASGTLKIAKWICLEVSKAGFYSMENFLNKCS